jgi:hypothetical protein
LNSEDLKSYLIKFFDGCHQDSYTVEQDDRFASVTFDNRKLYDQFLGYSRRSLDCESYNEITAFFVYGDPLDKRLVFSDTRRTRV